MNPSSDATILPGAGEPPGSSAAKVERAAVEAKDGEGFDLWHTACRPVFDVSNREPLARFDAALEFYEVDGLLFNRTRYSAVSFRRTPTHLRRGDNDPLVLHMLLRGGERGEVDGGGPIHMDPGRIVLHDWAHPFTSISKATEQLCVVIPRERLVAADRLYAGRTVVSWDLDSPSGRILGTALQETWHCLPQATRADAPAMAAGFLGLLTGFLDPSRSGSGSCTSDQAMAGAMRDFLQARLEDPDLGIEELTTAFRCSRSTIYRLFRDVGGVRVYLTESRLAKAFRMLTAGKHGNSTSIASVSRAVGFGDASYFHRAFRSRYGITPKDALFSSNEVPLTVVATPEPSSAKESLQTIHHWLGASE